MKCSVLKTVWSEHDNLKFMFLHRRCKQQVYMISQNYLCWKTDYFVLKIITINFQYLSMLYMCTLKMITYNYDKFATCYQHNLRAVV